MLKMAKFPLLAYGFIRQELPTVLKRQIERQAIVCKAMPLKFNENKLLHLISLSRTLV
jgi:hypothetical protein